MLSPILWFDLGTFPVAAFIVWETMVALAIAGASWRVWKEIQSG